MAIKLSIRTFNTDDITLGQFVTSVSNAFKQVSLCGLIFGTLHRNLLLTSGVDNYIAHGLDRNLIGYFVVRRNANSQVWESATKNNFPDRDLILNVSAGVTVSLWVF